MIKKISIYICFAVLFTCFLAQGSMAKEFEKVKIKLLNIKFEYPGQEVEFELVHVMKSLTPFFVDEDPTQIAGFQYEEDILLHGVVIGTNSGTATLLEPPLDLTATFSFGTLEETATYPGLGTLDVSGYFIGLTNSNTLSTGEITLSSMVSVTNGTGGLEYIYGVVAGIGTGNLFTSQGTMTQRSRFRLGY